MSVHEMGSLTLYKKDKQWTKYVSKMVASDRAQNN